MSQRTFTILIASLALFFAVIGELATAFGILIGLVIVGALE